MDTTQAAAELIERLDCLAALADGPGDRLAGYLSMLYGAPAQVPQAQDPAGLNVLVVTDSALGATLASALAGTTAGRVEVGHVSDLLPARPPPGPPGPDEAHANLAGYLVVAALETPSPAALRRLNRMALARGFTWIHAIMDVPYLVIGPTFLPGASACYECFGSQVSFPAAERGDHQPFRRALAQGWAPLGDSDAPAPVHGLLAALTSLEAINYLCTGAAFTIGKALAVHLPAMEFTCHEVRPVPGCPACGGMARQTGPRPGRR
jgi:bacteriocin biosynthesis cyclodehydratase domain-containing protein